MLQLRHLLHATSKRVECPRVDSCRVRFVGSFAMLVLLKMHKANPILSFSMEEKVLKYVMWLTFYLVMCQIINNQLLVTGVNVLHLGVARILQNPVLHFWRGGGERGNTFWLELVLADWSTDNMAYFLGSHVVAWIPTLKLLKAEAQVHMDVKLRWRCQCVIDNIGRVYYLWRCSNLKVPL